jgi:hypothetical protein
MHKQRQMQLFDESSQNQMETSNTQVLFAPKRGKTTSHNLMFNWWHKKKRLMPHTTQIAL